MSQSEEPIFLSAAIITYNEEKNIHDCIASVHDWCDEVLVLDSFSTDKTREVAEKFPRVRFVQHPFDGHIQQKNRAIEMVRGRWIFSLDADERVTPELAESIQKFIKENPDASAARVYRLTYHLGKFIRYGGWYNARYRLIRKGEAFWGGENPHDLVSPKKRLSLSERRRCTLKGDLIHYSFRDFSHQIDTINKFSSIVAFTRAGKKRKFSLLKLIVKPPAKFIEIYIFKFGFLDGIPGFILSVSSSFSMFAKIAKLYELTHTDIERPGNLRGDYKAQ